jgi:hypothetical protein
MNEVRSLTSDDKVGPAGRILEVNALNVKAGCVLGIEQNGAEVDIARVENLTAGEFVPPTLAVTVQDTLAIDLDVLATPLPEHD